LAFATMEKTTVNKTIVVLSDASPTRGSGLLIHYENLQVKVRGWETHDVRETIKDNEEEWFSELDSWHRACMEELSKETKWWSLFSMSRLLMWESIGLKSILFAAAITKLAVSQKYSVIRIIKPSKELISYLHESSLRNNFLVIEKKKTLKFLIVTSNLIHNLIFSYFSNLKLILKIIWVTIFTKKIYFKQSDVIVLSTLMNPDLISKIGDHYFGKKFEENNNTGLSISWLYNDLFINRKNAYKELKKVGRNAYFISELVDFKDLFFSLINGFKSLINSKKIFGKVPELQIGDLKSSIFTKVYVSEGLVFRKAPFIELMIYSQFKRIINNSHTKFIIYPYEEKPLERSILLAVNNTTNNIKSIAFAHAAYSLGNLYMRRTKKNNPPSSDLIAVTGDLAKKRFIKLGVQPYKLINIGSPRYVEKQEGYPSLKRSSLMKVLFITSYGFEMINFADLLINNVELSERFSIFIRRSYHSWFKEQDEAERQLINHGVSYECTNQDLIAEIDKVDVVIYEATTAAFQASLRGKIIIQLQLSDILPTEHFYEFEGVNQIQFSKNAENLLLNLKYIESLTIEEYKIYAAKQRKQVEMLLSKGSHDFFFNLFDC